MVKLKKNKKKKEQKHKSIQPRLTYQTQVRRRE